MSTLACSTCSTADSPPPAASSALPTLAVSDLDAVNAVIGGHREMFEVIVRRYNPQLYRVGMAYLRDHAQAEDAMQNTYLKAFLHLDRFRRSAGFGTWLTRIMINECLMLLRAKKRFHMETLDENGAAKLAAFVAPPADTLHQEELKAALERAVQTLPRTQRSVYVLREVQHLSTAETAECLGLSRENVKVILHRAREALKADLLKGATRVELFDYPARYCDPLTARVMNKILACE
jgi:RNA polymerase sigma factor (sigma-70 family)